MFRDKKESGKFYLVLEYLEGGDLRRFLTKQYRGGMPVDLVLNLAEQLIKATEFIHSQGYLHRDIKPGNILLGAPGSLTMDGGTQQSTHYRVLKVADFGLGRQAPFPPKPMTKEIATLSWRAPEVILDNTSYSAGVDMWSIGVVIYEMLTG